MSKFENHLVSIVTPAYKAAAFVDETIQSVIAQEYTEWEMLVVDDRSPDDTAAVVTAHSVKDPRVRLIKQAVNGGPAMARNAGLAAARGRYIAFLDSDDLWMPTKLLQQLEFMRSESAAFTFTAFRRISQYGERTGHLIQVPDQMGYRSLLKNTAIATSTVIVDREVAGDLRMTKTYYDDFVMWLELMKRGVVGRGLNVDLMRYRVLPQSVSRNKLNSAKHVWRTYRDIEKLGRMDAAWCFANYAVRGWLKYRNF